MVECSFWATLINSIQAGKRAGPNSWTCQILRPKSPKSPPTPTRCQKIPNFFIRQVTRKCQTLKAKLVFPQQKPISKPLRWQGEKYWQKKQQGLRMKSWNLTIIHRNHCGKFYSWWLGDSQFVWSPHQKFPKGVMLAKHPQWELLHVLQETRSFFQENLYKYYRTKQKAPQFSGQSKHPHDVWTTRCCFWANYTQFQKLLGWRLAKKKWRVSKNHFGIIPEQNQFSGWRLAKIANMQKLVPSVILFVWSMKLRRQILRHALKLLIAALTVWQYFSALSETARQTRQTCSWCSHVWSL